jgi:putative tryptophan/tyrosine transport system substrate-binding protein
MRRRDFLTLVGGTTFALSRIAVAQSTDKIRRIGVLSGISANDPDVPLRVAAFREGLRERGWTEGQTIKVEYRWSAGDLKRMQSFAEELVELRPEIIVAQSTPAVISLLKASRTVPIVFVNVADPIGSGLVNSLAKPGANVTGFTNFEPTMGEKWLELLKEVSPRLTRVCLMFNPNTTPSRGAFFLRLIESAAPTFSVQPIVSPVTEPHEIERVLAAFAQEPDGGLIPLPDTFMSAHRRQVIALAAQHRLPAVYPFRYFAIYGGLMSYGVETVDIYRRSAAYVDRILRGAKPADLPVQAPTKFEFVINQKTAAALGITIPTSLLARAEEVIE